MLEVKNLIKTYKAPKGGQDVHALDDVSITFPEKGMVFLLGKSGSGKSTLLNVIGGLDRPDGGEIIIKGRNSKDFSSADFDSYRNTFIGFIFQEYNILNEFNIEQNISLALQLQGKPNDKKAVSDILKQVDLENYGKRKPNTLSGGQKQRVAIARALIKNPEIIMADEPTGALDSNTGKQVFDTLKKLSETKLVIVVSHDRDFAEHYGDRIIELADGKIICDVTKEYVSAKNVSSNIQIINDNTIAIKDASKLDKKDTEALFTALKGMQGEAIISSGSHDVKMVREIIHVNSDNTSEVFNETKDVEVKEYNPKETKFIRSHLPFSRAFKMGASSLKTKPIRLIFTGFLTMTSLVLFGLASSLMLFNQSFALSRAFSNTDKQAETITKYEQGKIKSYRYNVKKDSRANEYSYEYSDRVLFGKQEIASISKNGLSFAGTFFNDVMRISNMYDFNQKYYTSDISNFIEADNEYLSRNNFSILEGHYPSNKDECAITEYDYELMKLNADNDKDEETNISLYSDVIGKSIKVMTSRGTITSKISAVIDVGVIPERYKNVGKTDSDLTDKQLQELEEEYRDFLNGSFYNSIFVSDQFYDQYKNYFINSNNYYSVPTVNVNGLIISSVISSDSDPNNYYNSYSYESVVETSKLDIEYFDLNDNKIAFKSPAYNEIYLPLSIFRNYRQSAYRNYFNRVSYLINSCNYYDYTSFFESKGIDFDLFQEILNRLTIYYSYDNSNYIDGRDANEDIKLVEDFLREFENPSRRIANIKEISSRLLDKYPSLNDDSVFMTYYSEINNTSDYSHLSEMENYFKDATYKNFVHKILIYLTAYEFLNTIYWEETLGELVNDFNSASDELFSRCEEILKTNQFIVPDEYEIPNYNPVFVFALNDLVYKYISYNGAKGELKVLGFFADKSRPYDYNFYYVNESFLKENAIINEDTTIYFTEKVSEYVEPEDAIYNGAITKTNYSQSELNGLTYVGKGYRYALDKNAKAISLATALTLINILKNVFLYAGIGAAVFASLMLLNFISTSIASKTKEIGILRAVGTRGSDLFKIFFSESGLLTLICLIISIVGSFVLSIVLNNEISKGIGVEMLNFGIINIGAMIIGALLIAVLGTIVPVIIAAKKPPVDSIRSL